MGPPRGPDLLASFGQSAGVVRPKPQPTGVTIYSSPRDMGTVTLPPQTQ